MPLGNRPKIDGMNNNAGEAVFVIRLDTSEAVRDLGQFQSDVKSSMTSSQESTRSLSDGFSELTSAVANLATAHYALSGTASAIGSVVNAYNEYGAAMNGVKAAAQATGNDVSASFQAVKDVTASGLITQSDAAAAIKNLQLYGYSAEEAAQMIDVMTNAAVYSRQANYSVSEAVRVTTEGIRMENSVLSDASGITTNIARMYENYAAELGKSTNNLTQAEKAQAVYNGFLQEGGIFAGNAESYTQTLAGSQQQLDTAMTQVSQTMGSMFSQFAPIVSGFAEWVSENQQLVATLATTVGILAAGGGLIAAFSLAVSAVKKVSRAMTSLHITSKAAQGGLIGLAVAAATIGAAVLVANGINSMADSMDDASDTSGELAPNLEQVGSVSADTAKKIAKLRDQLADLDREYQRDLKKIAVSHEDNLKTLTEQIEDANIDYRRAIDERMADFNVTLAKQERTHQETVDELMTQLSFLQRYNNDYNKQKLKQVEAALAIEQNLYQQETAARQAEIELQNEADRQKLETKLASLQAELDDEVAFMNKHRDALNSVRDVILLDEIESLRERYEEQRASYNQQIADAYGSGIDTANSFDSGWEAAKKTLYADVATDYGAAGRASATSWTEGFRNYMSQGGIISTIWKLILGEDTYAKWTGGRTKEAQANGALLGASYADIMRKMSGGYAEGGYTGRGAVDEVAGVVHRGEFVVPANQVDQSTGAPKIGTTQNITINLTGVLATSAQAKRDLAQELVKALNQVNQTRMMA